MRLLRTKVGLRIAVGAIAAVAVLLPSLAPALQTAAILAGGMAVVAVFTILMRTDPPS